MKSQKGITLLSLIIYVIVLLIIAGVVGVITTSVYTGVVDMDRIFAKRIRI